MNFPIQSYQSKSKRIWIKIMKKLEKVHLIDKLIDFEFKKKRKHFP